MATKVKFDRLRGGIMFTPQIAFYWYNGDVCKYFVFIGWLIWGLSIYIKDDVKVAKEKELRDKIKRLKNSMQRIIDATENERRMMTNAEYEEHKALMREHAKTREELCKLLDI